MRIRRHFTTAGNDPYEGVSFDDRGSRIVNPDGSTVFEATELHVPAQWSQVATDILAQKYFRKAGVPESLRRIPEEDVPEWLWRSEPEPGASFGAEHDARQAFHRLAGTWAYWGWKHGYFDAEDDARAFYDELCYMLSTQRAAPNSPQWFNTGLHWAYGITGPPQGHHYVDLESGEPARSTSAYERPQPHACFIQSVADDLVNDGGIMDLWTREARVFKYGSGTGSNFSAIRGEEEPLSGGGRSSGLMSFLKIGDRAAGAIKSGGTTRRAAKMVIVNADHPDVEKFIDWKVDEEHKVATMVAGSRVLRRHLAAILDAARHGDTEHDGLVLDPATNRPLRRAIRRARRDGVPELYVQRVLQLAKQGEQELDLRTFDTDWQGEAYQSVSGQNSNNSVRVTEQFLAAVRDGREWSLRRRTDGSVSSTLPASSLWERVARAAWQSADPGLQFDTTVNEWHTSPAGGRINGSNPCSEYMFLDDTACNLASLNLLPFLDEETGVFDTKAYEHAARLWTIVLEISVLMAQFPSREIAQRSYDYRTLGLGYANIGALLMVQGIPYDSPEALAWTGALSAILTGTSYAASAELAADLGPFARFAENRATMLRVVHNHRRAAYAVPADEYEGLSVLPAPLDESTCPPDLLAAARSSWDRAVRLGEAHGYRNAQATLIAPTGTIGLLMDCDTTGVEPDFALVKFKKLAGGGYFRIINHAVPRALARLGYRREQIDEIVDYCAGTSRLEGAPFINRHTLAQAGLTQPALDRIDEALRTAFHIRFVFNRYTLGEQLCADVLGIPEEELDDPDFDMLTALGFDERQVEAANDHILGRMTIEGSPHLREKDYPVFDCATTCGRYGTRYIEPMAHVRIMAAAQPFLSGAISKTINMPNSATVDDVKQVYMASAESMLKAIALYRDGSKLSQPLAAALFEAADTFDTETEDVIAEMLDELAAASAPDRVLAVAGHLAHLAERGLTPATERALGRGSREPLPSRRHGYAQKAKVGGHTIYLHTGHFESNDPDTGRPRLGELFISMSKDGAAFRSLMNCFAIAVSIGLQHGVPLSAYVDSFVFTKFEPNGIVTGHDRIQMATSIIDYVFRELGISYLGRDDLAHFGPIDLDSGSTAEVEEEPSPMPPGRVEAAAIADQPALREGLPAAAIISPGRDGEHVNAPVIARVTVAEAVNGSYEAVARARQQGFEGDPCDECGQMMMVRNGTCLKCMSCGSTSGCS